MPLNVSWKKQKDDDTILTEQFKENGDLEILGVLYEKYMHLVYGVCLKYFEDREEAKDGVSNIFEKLITEIPKHDIVNFKSWLYVLTKNYCLMQLRSSKSKDRKKSEWQIDQDDFMESSHELHPLDEDEANLNKVLLECIKELKEQQQCCVKLFYFDNKSYKEIAEELKLEEKKVKSFIQNGKRNLKICIENKHDKRA